MVLVLFKMSMWERKPKWLQDLDLESAPFLTEPGSQQSGRI